MATPVSFCRQCGTALDADSRFCKSCGAEAQPSDDRTQLYTGPLAGPPQPPPPYTPRPIAGSRQTSQYILIGVCIAVLLATLITVIYVAATRNKPDADMAGLADEEDAKSLISVREKSKLAEDKPEEEEEEPDTEPLPRPLRPGQLRALLGAFEGTWAIEGDDIAEPGDEIIELLSLGDRIVGTIGLGPNHIELYPAPNDTLQGTFTDNTEGEVPVTADVTTGGDKLVLTFAPPASEFWTLVAWRVYGEPDRWEEEHEPPAPTMTPELAGQIVGDLPEVQEWLGIMSGSGAEAHLEVIDEDANSFTVHVFEQVYEDDGSSHTATMNWYRIDKATGEITPTL